MFIMYKLLVLSCLLACCCSNPLGFESWWRELAWRIHGRGCADRSAGWLACAGAARGSLAPHPRDCRFFFYCSSSGARPACRPCPNGLYFNPELQVCDWPDQANCTARPPPPLWEETSTWLPETASTDSPLLSSSYPPFTAPSNSTDDTIGTTDTPGLPE